VNAALFYVEHIVLAVVLLSVFFAVYTHATPYNEVQLIKAGNEAAAFSLGGSLLGFSLTVGSSIVHNESLLASAAWAAGALVVQLFTYAVLSRLFRGLKECIESGNRAVGLTVGVVSFAVGVVNAACLS
jgi:putative membrane protein